MGVREEDWKGVAREAHGNPGQGESQRLLEPGNSFKKDGEGRMANRHVEYGEAEECPQGFNK